MTADAALHRRCGLPLRARNLTLRYTATAQPLFELEALDVAPGTTLGICGDSGSGKTSLLHCLGGLLRPSSGDIRWGDANLSGMGAAAQDGWRRSNLGLIFQDFHLIASMSVLDNVLVPVWLDRWRAPAALRARAQELLHAVGLQSLQQPVAQLSRGERQRVALARALLGKPGVVLADEPTASLDPAHRQHVADLLLDLVQAHGSTLIVVSHEHTLLARMERCLRLHQGQLRPHAIV